MPESMDVVFQSLASPVRRKILDLLIAMPGSCLNDLCQHFPISRIAILKHLRVLEEAQLIILRQNGRKKEIYFNAVPIQMIYDRWTTQYSKFWASKAMDLKFRLEAKASAEKKRRAKVHK